MHIPSADDLGKTCIHLMRIWTWDRVFVTSVLSTTILNLLSDTSPAPPNEITMVEPSSFDDLSEQPTLGNQPNAPQDLDSGSVLLK